MCLPTRTRPSRAPSPARSLPKGQSKLAWPRAALCLGACLIAVGGGLLPGGPWHSAALAAATPATPAVPACRVADVATDDAAYEDWAATIVDTALRLPPGYAPPDLVPVTQAGLAGRGRVRSLAIADLTALVNAASRAGVPLAAISAYRSEADQAAAFAEWEATGGHTAALLASARPGHSEHQLGTAIDFDTPGVAGPWTDDFESSAQADWLAAHAAEFGFVQSLPSTGSPDLTCYQAEPWHYRYVGREEAGEVQAGGEPLRVYLFQHANPPSGTGQAQAAMGTPTASEAAPETAASPASPSSTASGMVGTGTVPLAVSGSAGSSLPELPIGIVIGLLIGLLSGRLVSALRAARRRAGTGCPSVLDPRRSMARPIERAIGPTDPLPSPSRSQSGRSQSGRPRSDRPSTDQLPPSERQPSDRPPSDQLPPSERQPSDRPTSDRPRSDRPRSDRPRSDRPSSDHLPPSERPTHWR